MLYGLIALWVVWTIVKNLPSGTWGNRVEKPNTYGSLWVSDIDGMNGFDFEQYVARLLECQGFKVTVTPKSGDYGVDLVAEQNGSRFAIQTKRQASKVSRSAVSDAVGGMHFYKCHRTMVVTNNFFTESAITLAASCGCQLVDRPALANWIEDYHRSQPFNMQEHALTPASQANARRERANGPFAETTGPLRFLLFLAAALFAVFGLPYLMMGPR